MFVKVKEMTGPLSQEPFILQLTAAAPLLFHYCLQYSKLSKNAENSHCSVDTFLIVVLTNHSDKYTVFSVASVQ